MTESTRPNPAEALKALGATPQELAVTLQRELDTLEDVLARVQPHWNTTIPGRTWTAAQEAEHIILMNEGGARAARLLLSDRPLPDVPRVPVELDAQGRRQAPPSMQPGAGQPWEALQPRHKAAREALLDTVRQADGRVSQRTLFHPALGDLDALGWLRVTTWHLRDHRQQLQKLLGEGQ